MLLCFSLYPWVNKNGRFAIKHPEILTENFETLTAEHQPYYGTLKVKIAAPRDNFHATLPYRSPDGKLCFAFCRTCCNEFAQESKCPHTEEERAFTGLWHSDEINDALLHGYKVLEVYEVWHYKDSMQYDGKDEGSGLFDG